MASGDLEQLKESLSDLTKKVEALRREKDAKAQGWASTLKTLTPFLSGVLLAGVATLGTYVYNRSQMKLAQIEALDKYRGYLVSQKPEEREFGYQAFVELGYDKFVLKLIDFRKDPAGFNVSLAIAGSKDEASKAASSTADDLMAKATAFDRQAPPPPVDTERTAGTERKGWAYLGHYSEAERRWVTRYFEEVEDSDAPASLVARKLTVRRKTGALNVRDRMPSLVGTFGKVVNAINPGSEVTIEAVEEWLTSGYWWARIGYRT